VPAGHWVGLGGKLRELGASQADFIVALVLAALLVFCVLAMLFGGLVLPLVIMATIPLGAVGALGRLAVMGGTLNVFSGVGLLVCGLVTKNGILIVNFARQAEAEGQPRPEALRLALAHRLRPIPMTSGAMTIGMGHGGERLVRFSTYGAT
jgi:multidrug efflux pump subunit AcrB